MPNCGKSDNALAVDMVLSCRPAPDAAVWWSLTASAITLALANGQSVPNTICSGRATPARHAIVCGAGDKAVSYQKRPRRAKICSGGTCGSRGAIIGENDRRQGETGI